MSFDPVYDFNAKVLILGSYPSPASWANGFYYGHPQNRFWNLMSQLLRCEPPITIPEKKQMLLSHQIALWDVLKSCETKGAADSSIKNPEPNDIVSLLRHSKVQTIFTNGSVATKLYRSFCGRQITIPQVPLPSTSPANAKFRMDDLMVHWKQILESIT